MNCRANISCNTTNTAGLLLFRRDTRTQCRTSIHSPKIALKYSRKCCGCKLKQEIVSLPGVKHTQACGLHDVSAALMSPIDNAVLYCGVPHSVLSNHIKLDRRRLSAFMLANGGWKKVSQKCLNVVLCKSAELLYYQKYIQ